MTLKVGEQSRIPRRKNMRRRSLPDVLLVVGLMTAQTQSILKVYNSDYLTYTILNKIYTK